MADEMTKFFGLDTPEGEATLELEREKLMSEILEAQLKRRRLVPDLAPRQNTQRREALTNERRGSA